VHWSTRSKPRPAKPRRPLQALTVSSRLPSVKAASKNGADDDGDPRGFDDPSPRR